MNVYFFWGGERRGGRARAKLERVSVQQVGQSGGRNCAAAKKNKNKQLTLSSVAKKKTKKNKRKQLQQGLPINHANHPLDTPREEVARAVGMSTEQECTGLSATQKQAQKHAQQKKHHMEEL